MDLQMELEQQSTGGWKKWFAIGLGFGIGAAIAGGIIAAYALWFTSRPKPWKGQEILAAFSTPVYSLDEHYNIVGTELEYVIENTTMKDFTLSPEAGFFLQDGGALRRSLTGKYKIADQCFIPARTRMKCRIAVPAEFDVSAGVDGFAVFDEMTREHIIFPKPSGPTADERKQTLASVQQLAARNPVNTGIQHIVPAKH